MAVEARRGCGYRKVGGKYLVSGGEGRNCGRFPIPLHVCATCGGGIKQSRGWTWIKPELLDQVTVCSTTFDCNTCPVATKNLGERLGLLWIGRQFYPTPLDWLRETARLGMSRRITAVPRGFKVGETWVAIAHPAAITGTDEAGNATVAPGVIQLVRPDRIEQIITETMSRDAEFMADLDAKGVTPVIVPDDDKDHQGSVYDKEVEDDAPRANGAGKVVDLFPTEERP
jgi:hypothetical protein